MVSSTMRVIDPKTKAIVTIYQRPTNKKPKTKNVVRVVPRKKTVGDLKIERNSDCVEVSIDKIKALSHLSQTQAANQLGLSVTALKHACRSLGFGKWPREQNDISNGASPSNASDSASKASVPVHNETKGLCAVLENGTAPTFPLHDSGSPQATVEEPSVTVEISNFHLEPRQAEGRLKNQESFASLGLVDASLDEAQAATDAFPAVFGVGKHRQESMKEVSPSSCQLVIPRLEDKEEQTARDWAMHYCEDSEWEEELQDFLWSMEQKADESRNSFGAPSAEDFQFGKFCFEHARLARESKLWTISA